MKYAIKCFTAKVYLHLIVVVVDRFYNECDVFPGEQQVAIGLLFALIVLICLPKRAVDVH